MQEILASVIVWNPQNEKTVIRHVGLVDTGCRYPVLPMQWKEILAPFPSCRQHQLLTADQRASKADTFGPIMLKVGGFVAVPTEVAFLEMTGDDNRDFALIGHLVLQQAEIVVNLVTHRLFRRSQLEAI